MSFNKKKNWKTTRLFIALNIPPPFVRVNVVVDRDHHPIGLDPDRRGHHHDHLETRGRDLGPGRDSDRLLCNKEAQ